MNFAIIKNNKLINVVVCNSEEEALVLGDSVIEFKESNFDKIKLLDTDNIIFRKPAPEQPEQPVGE